MNKRIEYFDVAKGIMMVFLIFHHTIDFTHSISKVHDNSFVEILCFWQKPLFLCYFMQAFFFITGYCSNFYMPYRIFVLKQVKTLLFPAFLYTLILSVISAFLSGHMCDYNVLLKVLLNGGAFWFLVALFLSKIIYKALLLFCKNEVVILLILLTMSISSTLLNSYKIENYWAILQVLDLTMYLHIGNILKGKIDNRRLMIGATVFYFLLVIPSLLFGIILPHVSGGFCCTIYEWPLHVALSISGSISIICLASVIRTQPVLEYIGRISMIIYIFQGFVLQVLVTCFDDLLRKHEFQTSFTTILAINLTALSCISIVAYVINQKYLRWTLGKF